MIPEGEKGPAPQWQGGRFVVLSGRPLATEKVFLHSLGTSKNILILVSYSRKAPERETTREIASGPKNGIQ